LLFIVSLVQSIFMGACSWIFVYVELFAYFQGVFFSNTRHQTWKSEVEANRRYNYGWEFSLREKWSMTSYERYFQMVDKDFLQKMFTGCFFSSLQKYLSDHNIETDQFKQTTTKIINEGVLITGGEIKAENMAVGKRPRVNLNIANKKKE